MEEEAEEVRQEVEGAGGEEGTPYAGFGGEEGKEKEEEEKEVSFDELGLDEQLKRALRKKGIAKATPIQQEAIPLILVRYWLLFSFCWGRFFVSVRI
jgi:ATP-dependent RNA helicase DDX56/DBP9